jgi:ubiquinone/menaquinone biosynthesis C-methylase UbiE
MTEPNAPYQAAQAYKDENFARQYDRSRYHQTPARQQRDRNTQRALMEVLGRLEGGKALLDLPCGTGRLSRMLIDAGYTYTGSDISQEMIDIAIEKTGEAHRSQFVQANGEALPFEDEAFDIVLSVRFLGRVPVGPRLNILKEMHRVSKRYLVAATGYFRPKRPILDPLFARHRWLLGEIAYDAGRHLELHQEIAAAGWKEHFWLPYKSRGFFSTTKYIAVYTK